MLAHILPLTIAALAFSLTTLSAYASDIALNQDLPKTLLTRIESRANYIALEAKLEAIKQSTVSAQTSGIVEKINFDINDRVKAGQVLILINNSQQQAVLSQSKAALAQAQALNKDAQIVLKRHRALLQQKTLSQGEFDSSLARANSADARVLAAKAHLAQAQEQLSYTRILAPYSGIVRQRFVQLGELVNPGQAVMTGFALKPLRAVVDIPQHLAERIANQYKSSVQAQNDPIYITANGQRYAGSHFTLFPYANSRFSSIRARINIGKAIENTAQNSRTSTGLIPGAWVQVQLPNGFQKGIYLPTSAILQQGEVSSIYIKNNESFTLRYVRLGHSQQDGTVLITSGLEEGERVALDALSAIQDNAKSPRSNAGVTK